MPPQSLAYSRPSIGVSNHGHQACLLVGCLRAATQEEKLRSILRLQQTERQGRPSTWAEINSCDPSIGVCSLVVSCSLNLPSIRLRHIFHGAFKTQNKTASESPCGCAAGIRQHMPALLSLEVSCTLSHCPLGCSHGSCWFPVPLREESTATDST